MVFSKKRSLYFLLLFGRRHAKKMHVVLNVLAYTGSKFLLLCQQFIPLMLQS